jgi:hypothetical protein
MDKARVVPLTQVMLIMTNSFLSHEENSDMDREETCLDSLKQVFVAKIEIQHHLIFLVRKM